jgi:hypothetical protein
LEECLDAKEEILEEADMFLSDLNTLEWAYTRSCILYIPVLPYTGR